MLIDECIWTYYDKYYEKKKKQTQENLLKSVRDRLLSYIEMSPKASSSRPHLIRDLKERKEQAQKMQH